MVSRRNRWVWMLPPMLALLGCGEKSNPYRIPPIVSGVVRLDVSLSDAVGNPLGTQIRTTTDGVSVWLLEGGRPVDSTTTFDGAYSFFLAKSHSYRTACGIPPTFLDSSGVITPPSFGGIEADTLRLGRRGDLVARPNPFSGTVSTQFSLATAAYVELGVYDLAARRVRVLGSSPLPAGVHMFLWDGTDDAAAEVPDGLYWVLFQSASETRAELVVKQP